MWHVSEEIELDLGLSIGSRTFQKEKLEKSNDCSNSDGNLTAMDPLRKREIQSLRKQEAKRKIEEKQQKEGPISAVDELLMMTVKKEDEFDDDERESKKNKVENSRSEKAEAKLCNEEDSTVNYASMRQMQYPCSQLQYVFNNGFAFPCVMPCWSPGGGAVTGNDKNFFQPVACQTFRPFQGVNHVSNGFDVLDQKKSKEVSDRSLVCCSYGVSNHRSSFNEGNGSNETRSYSSQSTPEQCQNTDSITNDTEGHSERCAPSNRIASTQVTCEPTNTTYNLQPKPIVPEEEPTTETKSDPINKPTSLPDVSKEAKKAIGKPPKPQTRNQKNSNVSLSQMPCVSTTGNGPNGKTVTGVLYRYTKAEVSIVCVCHGKSFSPAEFVEHAGGTDISNPLRHITVVPSAFG